VSNAVESADAPKAALRALTSPELYDACNAFDPHGALQIGAYSDGYVVTGRFIASGSLLTARGSRRQGSP
jgi:hypothetical protein